ncbi:MAG: hypothetical protein ACK4QW_13195 [Alphaproteobacteria bacterium]
MEGQIRSSIWPRWACKTDVFDSDASQIGGWPTAFHTGWRDNLMWEGGSVPNSHIGPGSWRREAQEPNLVFPASALTPATQFEVLDGFHVPRAAGPVPFVPAGQTCYRFDMRGTVVPNDGTARAGAIQIPVAGDPAPEEPDPPPPDPGDITTLYQSYYTLDQTGDYVNVSAAALFHAPNSTHPAIATPGSVAFHGSGSQSTPEITLTLPAAEGDRIEAAIKWRTEGSGSELGEALFRWMPSGQTAVNETVRTGAASNVVIAQSNYAPAGTTGFQIRFRIRGTPPATRQLHIHYLGVAEVGDNPGTPAYTGVTPAQGAVDCCVGRETELDFGPSFGGAATHYVYDGPEPHVWTGSVLRITPDTEDLTFRDRTVRAWNGPLESIQPVPFRLRSGDWEPLQIVEHTLYDDFLEPHHAYVHNVLKHIRWPSGVGAKAEDRCSGWAPWSFEVLAAPSWLRFDGGTLWAPDDVEKPLGSSTVSVRITDRRGDQVTVTWTCVVAEVSRSPDQVLPAGASLNAAIINAPRNVPWVIQLEAGYYPRIGNSPHTVRREWNAPLLILGALGPEGERLTHVEGLSLTRSNGVWIEDVEFRRTQMVSHPADAGSKNTPCLDVTTPLSASTLPLSLPCRAINCAAIGLEHPSLELEPTTSTWQIRLHPDTGELVWSGASGVPAEVFRTWPLPADGTEYGRAHYGGGFSGGPLIVQGCHTEKTRVGYSLSTDTGVFNSTWCKIRMDACRASSGYGHVYYKVRPRDGQPTFDGNYQSSEHRDSYQVIGASNAPSRGQVIEGCVFASDTRGMVQGLQMNLGPDSNWSRNHGLRGSHAYMTVRDTLILSAAQQCFNPSSLYEGIAERVVVSRDPRRTDFYDAGHSPMFSGGSGSAVRLTDCVITMFGQHVRGRDARWYPQVNVDWHAGDYTRITDYFPNWFSTTAPYDWPWQAGAGDPQLARFSAHGPAAVAHPERVPSFLLTV